MPTRTGIATVLLKLSEAEELVIPGGLAAIHPAQEF